MAQLDELRADRAPDMDAIGRLLTELSADEEFFAPLIAGMPAASMDVHWLVKPERGPLYQRDFLERQMYDVGGEIRTPATWADFKPYSAYVYSSVPVPLA